MSEIKERNDDSKSEDKKESSVEEMLLRGEKVSLLSDSYGVDHKNDGKWWNGVKDVCLSLAKIESLIVLNENDDGPDMLDKIRAIWKLVDKNEKDTEDGGTEIQSKYTIGKLEFTTIDYLDKDGHSSEDYSIDVRCLR